MIQEYYIIIIFKDPVTFDLHIFDNSPLSSDEGLCQFDKNPWIHS